MSDSTEPAAPARSSRSRIALALSDKGADALRSLCRYVTASAYSRHSAQVVARELLALLGDDGDRPARDPVADLDALARWVLHGEPPPADVPSDPSTPTDSGEMSSDYR